MDAKIEPRLGEMPQETERLVTGGAETALVDAPNNGDETRLKSEGEGSKDLSTEQSSAR